MSDPQGPPPDRRRGEIQPGDEAGSPADPAGAPSFGWRGPDGDPRSAAPPPPPPPPRPLPPDDGDAPESQPPPDRGDPVPRRLPVVALLLVFVVAAVFVERGSGGPPPAAPVSVAEATSTSAAGDGDGDGVWFCAAGTALGSTEAPAPGATPASPSTTTSSSTTTTTTPATGRRPTQPTDVIAEHRLLITNAADAPRRVHVTAYPSNGDKPVTRDLDVPSASRTDLDLSDLARATTAAAFVSAVVEVDGSRVAVAHRLRGPTGESTAPCSATTSRSWFFAAGSTEANTRQLVVLFNPFPQQVVVDVTFQAEDGDRQALRAPRELEGLVVPAQRTLAIDVTDQVADRRQLSTRIEARVPTARLVADRLLLNPGGPNELPFLSVGPGATAPRSAWVFADGRPRRTNQTASTTFVLYNPSSEPVEVEMRVRPDRLVAASEPFRVTVRTGQFQEITLDERVGADAGYWAALVARSSGTFVVERVVRANPQAAPAATPGGPPVLPAVVDAGGVTYTLGSPVMANEWIAPAAAPDGGAGLAAITNLGPSVVTLHVDTLVDGRATPVARYDGVTLEPGLRTTIDLADPALPGSGAGVRRSLRVRADGPIVVETSLAPPSAAVIAPRGVSDLMAAPVRDTMTVPFEDVLVRASPPTVEGAQDPPPGGVPGSVPDAGGGGSTTSSPPGTR
jgi:hypothetical protein